jgi:hypothetical protein
MYNELIKDTNKGLKNMVDYQKSGYKNRVDCAKKLASQHNVSLEQLLKVGEVKKG